MPMRERCPDTEFFMVRIFSYSVQIRENTDQKNLHIRTLFGQCAFLYFSAFPCFLQSAQARNVARTLTNI